MNAEPREPARLPVRGTIATVGTVGALALLLSFRGGPLAPAESVTAQEDETPAADELITQPEVAEREVIEADEPVSAEIRTATGDVVSIRWGDVQVAVIVEGDDIIDVETLAVPTDDRKSERINSSAEPILREEAMTYDTADVSVVSGATYTSEAYATSLQSALDQLGL